jgi:poly-gamma-glutamate capsule biosynthesis protein CapA/YwtB (metallophosphatase superfamily)
MHGDVVTVFLCGDVMLGRGLDQILPCPCDPRLREAYIRDARAYVELAEAVNGPIPRPVDFRWPWGEALRVLDAAAPDARVANLETTITWSDDFAPGKEIHYRMSPANVPCLTVAGLDVCVLANNHALDFGRRGLEETLDALSGAGVRTAGAGRDVAQARRPAIVQLQGGARVLVLASAMASSGVPRGWAASDDRTGVNFAAKPSEAVAAEMVDRVRQVKRPGDIVVASIHWGANWGYQVSRDEIRFAHALVDGGVDIVYGHSAHHPRPVEVHHGKLVLYGCGDFVDDYEGISGYEQYRDDLRTLYLVSVEADTGSLADLRMTPLQARRMRLWPATLEDCEWLRSVLNRISRDFGSRIEFGTGGVLALRRP